MQHRVLTVLSGLLLAAQPALGRPACVILVRHAEKPPDPSNVHLSQQGQQRARALAGLLTTNLVVLPNGPPTVLFAPKVTKRGHTSRPYETLEPLAQSLNLSVRTPRAATDYAALASSILADPSLDGKTVVVCWIHDYLPEMAAAFGVRPQPPRWKESVYDRVWVITYQGDQAVLKNVPQNLLPGDSPQ